MLGIAVHNISFLLYMVIEVVARPAKMEKAPSTGLVGLWYPQFLANFYCIGEPAAAGGTARRETVSISYIA